MRKECPAVMWRNDHQKSVKRWLLMFAIVNVLWIGGFTANYQLRYKPLLNELVEVFQLQNEKDVSTEKLKGAMHEYRVKYQIMSFLRAKGLSLGQGMDIAEAAVTESKANDLPLDLTLSLILTESEFSPGARSSSGAIGITQIMPATWEEYTKKMGLNVGIQAAYDPLLNIKVGLRYLGDLYKENKSKFKLETDVRKKALSVYNSGPNGGLQPTYVNTIEKGTKKFSNLLVPQAEAKELLPTKREAETKRFANKIVK